MALAVAIVAALFVLATPSTSFAASSTLWVAHAPTVAGNGKSCTKPGFNTIQAALTAAPAGANVRVCSGTYTEQLTITKAVSVASSGPVTVQLPATPVDSTTACDTAPGSGPHPQDGIDICGSGIVSLTGFTVDAAWAAGTCNDDLNAILVAGGATLKGSNLAITAAGAVPLNGCQGGVGIQIGMAWTTPVEVGHATLKNVNVSGYQKNGITVDGAGSTATITNSNVAGIGATDQIAQNGIQVSFGALGKITNSVVTGNECDHPSCGPDSLLSSQSTGVLFYAQAAGSKLSNSTLSNNDIGVYVLADPSKPAPTRSITTISGSHLTGNRDEQIVLDQGNTTLSSDVISGSAPAIQLIQYNGQTFGVKGTATGMSITGATMAVQVHSDVNAGDVAGSFTVSSSSFGGGSVVNENPTKFTLTQSHNTP
jgi:hypothetical protein